MPFERPARRVATIGALSLLVGACPALWAGDLAAQSGAPAGKAGPVVREIEERLPGTAQSGDPDSRARSAQGGALEPSPFAELNEALAAARAKLEELSAAAEVAAQVGELRSELEAAREENRRLQAELASLRAGRHELESAGEAAKARIAELSAEAERLRDETGGLRDRNAGLRAEVQAGEEALRKAAEQSGAEVAALRGQLEASAEEIAAATDGLERAEARVAELQGAIAMDRQVAAGLREELDHARDALSSAARDRQEGEATIADLRAAAGELRNRLTTSEDQVRRLEAANASLSADLQTFRTAASNATDAARQNLEAVESRVEALTAALTAVQGTAGPEAALDRVISENRQAGTPEPQVIAAVASAKPDDSQDPAGGRADAAAPPADEPAHGPIKVGGFDSDLARAKGQDDRAQLAGLTAELSLEKKLQVQALLSELKPAVDQRGLRLTVPGASLFRVNSDDIEETAYETLAKLAELINAYDHRGVLIVGHTDAIGDAAYNQMLSERRADLIKQFFVENFEIDEARVSTEGRGEEAPIASNATNAGRRANRRVEVLLLN
jgi:outer membrane protein OmpA-like peptidoglycan-associated protein/predicted  nucleic acid-binding Zn-ribbon protein